MSLLEPICAARGQHHVGARLGKCPGEGDAQTGRGTGDDCHLPVEPEAVEDRVVVILLSFQEAESSVES